MNEYTIVSLLYILPMVMTLVLGTRMVRDILQRRDYLQIQDLAIFLVAFIPFFNMFSFVVLFSLYWKEELARKVIYRKRK